MSAGNQKGEVFGGHLNRAIVSATCELVITVIDGRVDRVHDEETGLILCESKISFPLALSYRRVKLNPPILFRV
jgi:hypothetical protein